MPHYSGLVWRSGLLSEPAYYHWACLVCLTLVLWDRTLVSEATASAGLVIMLGCWPPSFREQHLPLVLSNTDVLNQKYRPILKSRNNGLEKETKRLIQAMNRLFAYNIFKMKIHSDLSFPVIFSRCSKKDQHLQCLNLIKT